jgi:uncharacterized membrane protein SpoIIM required for sporulation
MKEDRFITENSGTWRSLEGLLKALGAKGLRKFSTAELDSLLALYSRTYYGSSATTEYLNKLVASAHAKIYSTKNSSLKRFAGFFTSTFPELVWQTRFFLLISTLAFILGFLGSYILTIISPDNAVAFLPPEYIEGMDSVGSSGRSWDGALVSSIILTNNIRVGFTAFAMGLSLGIGTVLVLVFNGTMVGSLSALASHNRLDYGFWSLILPHGVIELAAIFICGAAGLIIGYSIINPGKFSRKDSLILGCKTGIKLIGGTIPMFVIAGLIEGFVTPLPIAAAYKYLIALSTLLLLVFYIVFCNLRNSRKPQTH